MRKTFFKKHEKEKVEQESILKSKREKEKA